MDFKIFRCLILFTVLVIVSTDDSCPVNLSFKGSGFNFTKHNGSFIHSCLKSVNSKIIWINIDFCTFENVSEMFRDVPLNGLERLTITNSGLQKIDIQTLHLSQLIYLDLSENALQEFHLPGIIRLQYLNLSCNRLTTFSMDDWWLNMDSVDLSNNFLINGAFNFSLLKKLNMSNGLNKEYNNINVMILADETSVDLSSNNITDIGFLHFGGQNGSLILDNNNLINLGKLRKIAETLFSLTISLANNPFHCELSLFYDWILIRSKSYDLGNDLLCSFANSNNLYSVNKYGHRMTNETNVLGEMWSSRRLLTYLSFQNLTITQNVSPAGISMEWSSETQTANVVYLLFRSQHGSILYSRRIFIKQNQRSALVEFNRVSGINDVCFIVEVPKQTLKGLERFNTTLQCQYINDGSSIQYKNAFIAVLVIGLVYILLTTIVFSFYCFKTRKAPLHLDNNSSGNFELECTSRNQDTALVNDTQFRQFPAQTTNIRLEKSRMTSKTLPPPRNAESYTNMGMSEESRSSTIDNVYEEFG